MEERMKENNLSQVAYWIKRLDMKPHPEGGFYKQIYRPEVSSEWGEFPTGRLQLTTIYYLLAGDDFSAFHRIRSTESWFYHVGGELLIYSIENSGLICRELSSKEGGKLQLTISPDTWFAARLKNADDFALVSCAVSPGFDFRDFELGKADALVELCPQEASLIRELCLESF